MDLEKTLEQILPKTPLYEAARYALMSGGKRIRPKLTLLTVEMLGGDVEAALMPAAALEMIHTYSLIHDDLPCMDDDDFRRGKPSVHKAFDEAAAVLAGDLLLTKAFEVIADAPNLEANQKIELISVLSKASGGEGMVGGQMLDLAHCSDITRLHEMKTAALFRAALHFGAIIGKSDPAPYIAFGTTFGLLFQAIDDIDDHDHPEGEEEAKKRAGKLTQECLALLDHIPNSEKLRLLVMEYAPDSFESSVYS